MMNTENPSLATTAQMREKRGLEGEESDGVLRKEKEKDKHMKAESLTSPQY